MIHPHLVHTFELDIGERSINDTDVLSLMRCFVNPECEINTMLRLNSRYEKMDTSERAHYRKELKFRLIALSCIYLGFSAWWVLMSPFAS
ncbi:hypothetical protein MNBD_GAMMA23-1476 [hydrothermal vent metagenome]|uniref:Uncharacterized protein n=1 Tax=hydrothermal vent metagenome TaxID=652676 RepID=A0A3B1ALI2_9ZZZZ